jgi:hypothetical protein
MRRASWSTPLRSGSLTKRMRRVSGRAACQRRMDYPLHVDWLEARSLMDGDPFSTPLPDGITPSPAAEVLGFIGPVHPVEASESGDPTAAANPDPTGITEAGRASAQEPVRSTPLPDGITPSPAAGIPGFVGPVHPLETSESGDPASVANPDWTEITEAVRTYALVLANFSDHGIDGFILGNKSPDQVSVTFGGTSSRFEQGRRNGLLAPADVGLTDLNRDGIPDLIVVNRGGNNILSYLGRGDGGFAVAFAVADLDSAGLNGQGLNSGERPNSTGTDTTSAAGGRVARAAAGGRPNSTGADATSTDPSILSEIGGRRSRGEGSHSVGGSLIALPSVSLNLGSFSNSAYFHNGGRVISLLLDGLGGFSPRSTTAHPNQAHRTVIALSSLGIAEADEGEETVSFLNLAFNSGIAVLRSTAAPKPIQRPDFLPLPGSNLAFVVVLLTDRLGGTDSVRTRTSSRDPDVAPAGNAHLINYVSGLDSSYERNAPSESDAKPDMNVLAPVDRALGQWLATITVKTGWTWDVGASTILDVTQEVASVVGLRLAPFREFVRGVFAEGLPAPGTRGPEGDPEDRIDDHPAIMKGTAAAEAPVSGTNEDGIEPAPLGLDAALPVAELPSSGDRPDGQTLIDAWSGTNAIAHLSAGVCIAAIAYQVSWSERRVGVRAGRGRDPEPSLRRFRREIPSS